MTKNTRFTVFKKTLKKPHLETQMCAFLSARSYVITITQKSARKNEIFFLKIFKHRAAQLSTTVQRARAVSFDILCVLSMKHIIKSVY